MFVNEMSVGEMPLDKMTVYDVYRQTDLIWHVCRYKNKKISEDEMTVYKMYVKML
jgi:hypothetical protein